MAGGPKFPKFIGRPGQRKTIGKKGGSSAQIVPKSSPQGILERTKKFPCFCPQGLWGELWEKIWVENPHFPYGFLWPGWSGAQNYQIIRRTAPQTTKNLATLPFGIFRVFSEDQNSPNRLGGSGHPSHPAKGNHRETGGFSALIFPGALPNNYLAWLAGAQNSQNLPGGQAKGKP